MKLTSANIEWEENQDMDKMMSLGIKSVPAIQYGDALITNFTEVNNFVNKRIEEAFEFHHRKERRLFHQGSG